MNEIDVQPIVMTFEMIYRDECECTEPCFIHFPEFIFQVMCIQYWPPALDKTEVYGDIHIGIVKEEQLANFQIRTFRIWKENLEVCAAFPIFTIPLSLPLLKGGYWKHF